MYNHASRFFQNHIDLIRSKSKFVWVGEDGIDYQYFECGYCEYWGTRQVMLMHLKRCRGRKEILDGMG